MHLLEVQTRSERKIQRDYLMRPLSMRPPGCRRRSNWPNVLLAIRNRATHELTPTMRKDICALMLIRRPAGAVFLPRVLRLWI